MRVFAVLLLLPPGCSITAQTPDLGLPLAGWVLEALEVPASVPCVVAAGGAAQPQEQAMLTKLSLYT